MLAYSLCVEEEDLHPGGIGEHLVDVELQGRDGVHCDELKGRVSVEGSEVKLSVDMGVSAKRTRVNVVGREGREGSRNEGKKIKERKKSL